MAASLSRVSAPSKEYQSRSARAPIFLAIPELDASNSPLVTRQVNCPCRIASPDSIPNLDIRVGAVLEMHNNSLELNGATLDPKLDRPERPAGIHRNVVMIVPTIYMRLSEAFPSALALITVTPLGICNETEAQQEQQRTEQTN
jgi:hypothetical protein